MQNELYRVKGGDAMASNVVAIAAAEDVALRGYTEEQIIKAVNSGEYVVLHSRAIEAARKMSKKAVLDDAFARRVITEWLKVRQVASIKKRAL